MEQMSHEPTTPKTVTVRVPSLVFTKTIAIVLVVAILCIVSFYGGQAYQRQHAGVAANGTSSSSLGQNSTPPTGTGGVRLRRAAIGTVTTASASSLTVQNRRTGVSTTYTITASTYITDSGAAVQASDIKNGDTVLVRTNAGNSTVAASITINPSIGPRGFSGNRGGASSI